MRIAYVPAAGDLIWIDFDPQVGREQAGHRPALVLSPESYNRASELLLCCPITSRQKSYTFEVKVVSGSIKGVVLVDHVRSVGWRGRGIQRAGRAPDLVLEEVRDALAQLLQLCI